MDFGDMVNPPANGPVRLLSIINSIVRELQIGSSTPRLDGATLQVGTSPMRMKPGVSFGAFTVA